MMNLHDNCCEWLLEGLTMKAVVMAGGEGSRLRPLTIGRPKPMVPIVNAPVMEHILGLLKRHGITEVVVTLQYMSNTIQDYFGDGSEFGMVIHYTVEETPLGTAGSVKNAEHLLDEPFIVISGDALTDFDLEKVISFHREREAMATLTLYQVPNPLEYGVVILDEEHRVTRFLEKPSWGEVFSDTVNTGIYVLDPGIFKYVPSGKSVDWSNDVFPQLLQNSDPMFGYVASGYWCDVGSLQEYVRANADMLQELVNLPLPGEISSGRIWRSNQDGEPDAVIHPTARVYGPVFLGKGVEVRAGAVIHGPTVIGDYTVVEERATIDRSVIWTNGYIGDGADLNGALIGKQVSLKSGTVVFEGAVIGDNCTIGEGAVVRPNVKLWPNKEVDPGATVASSLIWGNQARRSIFTATGVSGLANVEMVPEFAARVGAAYGSTLPRGSRVTVNRDRSRAARMIKRAIIAGLPSAGIDVLDIGDVPVPVARYETRASGAMGGIHVRLSPADWRQIELSLLDGRGLNIDKNGQRRIETSFFREDFRRVPVTEIGAISVVGDVVARRYEDAFVNHCDKSAITTAHGRAVIDYGFGSTSTILPTLLGRIGAETITVNAATGQAFGRRTATQYDQDLRHLSAICRAIGAQAGAMMDNDGTRIDLIDDRGVVLSPMTALAVIAVLAWRAHPGAVVGVPASAPLVFDALASRNGGAVLRIAPNARALMQAAQDAFVQHRVLTPTSPETNTIGTGEKPLILVGNGEGSYIFPDFHPGFDGMMAVARILQFLSVDSTSLSDVAINIPTAHLGRQTVPCPWDATGRVMRVMHEQASRFGDSGAASEGVRFDFGAEWVLVLPDADLPLFHVHAEGQSPEAAQALVAKHAEMIRRIVT